MAQIIESVEAINLVVPANDEWFELLVDNDIDPMEVVRTSVHDPNGWKYLGPKLEGLINYIAKLTHLGYAQNLREVRERADKIGLRLLEGQAIEPFKKKYPKPDCKDRIVCGGSEWQNPNSHALQAYLNHFNNEWYSSFHWSKNDFFTDNLRWLVAGKN